MVPREPTKGVLEAIAFAIYRYADADTHSADRAAPFVHRAMIAAHEGATND
jgi:hypothetical protein